MKVANVKVYQLTDKEIERLIRIALDLQSSNLVPTENTKHFADACIVQLKKELA